MTLIMAVCAGMKMGYTTDKMDTEEDEEEDFEQEDENMRWKKSGRTSCRLVEKRPAVSYEQQVTFSVFQAATFSNSFQTVSILGEQHGGGRRRKKIRFKDLMCLKDFNR